MFQTKTSMNTGVRVMDAGVLALGDRRPRSGFSRLFRRGEGRAIVSVGTCVPDQTHSSGGKEKWPICSGGACAAMEQGVPERGQEKHGLLFLYIRQIRQEGKRQFQFAGQLSRITRWRRRRRRYSAIGGYPHSGYMAAAAFPGGRDREISGGKKERPVCIRSYPRSRTMASACVSEGTEDRTTCTGDIRIPGTYQTPFFRREGEMANL